MAIATLSPPAVDVRRCTAVLTSAPRAIAITLALMSVACSGSGRELGEACDTSGECSDDLQCLQQVCVPRCVAHVDCGDGSVCDDGECRAVQSELDQPCDSELECGAGQTCRFAQQLQVAPGSCQREVAGALEGEACSEDADCRMGGCALGRCVSLCRGDECRRGWTCAAIPLPHRDRSVNACLPGNATIEFELPVPPPVPPMAVPEVAVPVPSTARSMVLVFEAPTPSLSVGAGLLEEPSGRTIYREPEVVETYYSNLVRHAPRPGISVLQVPSSTGAPLQAGVYTATVRSFHDNPAQPVNGRPRVRVIQKLGSAARLDLHFYFLDLADHPCNEAIGATLSADTARTLAPFQDQYVGELERIFRVANINLGEVTYHDLDELVGAGGRPDLDVLDIAQAPALFALADQRAGVSIFVVRSMEPDGQQILVGGTPGAPIPGTGASAIAVAVDSLCYRDWTQFARQTAHGLARHMGLFRNVEPDDHPDHVDPIGDSDDSTSNLMHWSEFGATELSLGQREILRASPVLR